MRFVLSILANCLGEEILCCCTDAAQMASQQPATDKPALPSAAGQSNAPPELQPAANSLRPKPVKPLNWDVVYQKFVNPQKQSHLLLTFFTLLLVVFGSANKITF